MTVVRDAAAAVRDADVVITMLTDGPAVIEVVRAAGCTGTATLVDMSTIGPDAVRDLAAVLPAGVDLVDAPVAGSTGAAEGGTLRIFAGRRPMPPSTGSRRSSPRSGRSAVAARPAAARR